MMMMMLFSRKGKGRSSSNNNKAVPAAGQQTTTGSINKRQTDNNQSLSKKDQPSSTRSVASTVSEASSISVASSSFRCSPLNPIASGPISPTTTQQHQPSSSSTSRVRFNPSLKIRETLHVNDYTSSEIANCWYDKFESDEIVNEAKFVISLYEDTNLVIIDENKYPKRGLEFLYMKKHQNSSSDNENNNIGDDENSSQSCTAKLSRQAVFDEQTKLKGGGGGIINKKKITSDPSKIQSRIQSVYTIYTQGSRMQARLLALSDELAVKKD